VQCINVKLKANFATKYQAVISTIYLRMPLFGMIPMVKLFAKSAEAMIKSTYHGHYECSLCLLFFFVFSTGQTDVELPGAEAADRAQCAAPD